MQKVTHVNCKITADIFQNRTGLSLHRHVEGHFVYSIPLGHFRKNLNKTNFSDDTDAIQDDKAGHLIFLARTCVVAYTGDSCRTGQKEGTAVTICNQHCMEDGCNAARQANSQCIALLLTICLIVIDMHEQR